VNVLAGPQPASAVCAQSSSCSDVFVVRGFTSPVQQVDAGIRTELDGRLSFTVHEGTQYIDAAYCFNVDL